MPLEQTDREHISGELAIEFTQAFPQEEASGVMTKYDRDPMWRWLWDQCVTARLDMHKLLKDVEEIDDSGPERLQLRMRCGSNLSFYAVSRQTQCPITT